MSSITEFFNTDIKETVVSKHNEMDYFNIGHAYPLYGFLTGTCAIIYGIAHLVIISLAFVFISIPGCLYCPDKKDTIFNKCSIKDVSIGFVRSFILIAWGVFDCIPGTFLYYYVKNGCNMKIQKNTNPKS